MCCFVESGIAGGRYRVFICDEKSIPSDMRMYSSGLNELTPAAIATGVNSQ
jgi:hypothetical protein